MPLESEMSRFSKQLCKQLVTLARQGREVIKRWLTVQESQNVF